MKNCVVLQAWWNSRSPNWLLGDPGLVLAPHIVSVCFLAWKDLPNRPISLLYFISIKVKEIWCMSSPSFAIPLHHAASLRWPHGDYLAYRILQCTPPPVHETSKHPTKVNKIPTVTKVSLLDYWWEMSQQIYTVGKKNHSCLPPCLPQSLLLWKWEGEKGWRWSCQWRTVGGKNSSVSMVHQTVD